MCRGYLAFATLINQAPPFTFFSSLVSRKGMCWILELVSTLKYHSYFSEIFGMVVFFPSELLCLDTADNLRALWCGLPKVQHNNRCYPYHYLIDFFS